MNILITGISGCIGRDLAYRLWKSNFKILGIDKCIDYDSHVIKEICASAGSKVFEYDLSVYSPNLLNIVEDFSPDVIFHFAAEKSISKSLVDPLNFWSNNLNSTINILKSFQNKKLQGIVFSSSAAIYDNSKQPISENYRINPISIYGKTKLTNEILLEDYHKKYGVNIAILRYFNVLGSNPEIDIYEDRQGDSMSIVGHILNTVEGLQKEFLVNGSALDTYDGTPERDYVHLKDITDANIKAMQAILENKISFDLINIGSGIKTSVLRLISEFEKNAQKKISLKYVSLPSNEIPTSSANIQKANELLDWSPKRDIKNIVEDCMKDTKYI